MSKLKRYASSAPSNTASIVMWLTVVVAVSATSATVVLRSFYLLHEVQGVHATSHSRLVTDNFSSTQSDVPRTPELFIYRRSKKTGSSSMLNALLDQLVPLGYSPLLYQEGEEMDSYVRSIFKQRYAPLHPKRLFFIAQHNHITRAFHPLRDAIIADTVRDGYQQITSFCRFARGVHQCEGDQMINCLRSGSSRYENEYRWAGKPAEDSDTYIDLPLSSSHPALSTSVVRTVFPNITLHVAKYNVRSTSCGESRETREVYEQLYAPLDKQTKLLKRRILTITGYPFFIDKRYHTNITLDDALNAAEEMESGKYYLESAKKDKAVRTYSKTHIALMSTRKEWTLSDRGLTIRVRRGRSGVAE